MNNCEWYDFKGENRYALCGNCMKILFQDCIGKHDLFVVAIITRAQNQKHETANLYFTYFYLPIKHYFYFNMIYFISGNVKFMYACSEVFLHLFV